MMRYRPRLFYRRGFAVSGIQEAIFAVLVNFKQVVKSGDLRLHPIIGRLVDHETLEKMGAEQVVKGTG